MFKQMRRNKQELSLEENIEILKRGTSGVLACIGEDEYSYAVPLSYVYHNSKIYFHCAKSGHKLDAIQYNNKVSFCVIDKDQIVPEEYTTYFRSVIVFGKARILDENEKRESLEILATKYSPYLDNTKEIDKFIKVVTMIEIDIEHMSGKQAKELVL